MQKFRLPRAFGALILACAITAVVGPDVAGAAQTATPKPAPATKVPGIEQVHATTLANGMRVIVWTDRDIPNVALYNWVRVGSRNEVSGITGLAHFFEHM